MTGFYPPFAPHELDGMGELGRRIQATIENGAADSTLAAHLRAELYSLATTKPLWRSSHE